PPPARGRLRGRAPAHRRAQRRHPVHRARRHDLSLDIARHGRPDGREHRRRHRLHRRRDAGARADPADEPVRQPQFRGRERRRPHRRALAVRRGDVPSDLSPGGERRVALDLRPPAHADDARHAGNLGDQRPPDQPLRPLQALPHPRHRDHDVRARRAVAAGDRERRLADRDRCALARARHGHGHAGAPDRGPEQRRLPASRRGHVRDDAVPLARRRARRRAVRRNLRQPPARAARRPRLEVLATVTPAAVRGLPPDLHQEYITAVMAALRPVFLAAAGISALGFVLTFLLREYPLREGAPAEGVGESFVMPRDATSVEELERIVALLVARENRWRLYADLARRAAIELPAPELWMLARLGERAPITLTSLSAELNIPPPQLASPLHALCERGIAEKNANGEFELTSTGVAMR